MKIILLAAGAAAIALSAGPTLAAAKGGPAVAGPKQPIPYSQLNAYLKASPKARVSKDWWSGHDAAPSTGAAANSSAIVPVSPTLPGDTAAATAPKAPDPAPSTAVNPPIDNPPTTTTPPSPPSAVAPGAPASTTPPK